MSRRLRPVGALAGVGVELEHESWVGVAETELDGAGVDTVGDPLGRCGVPWPVKGSSLRSRLLVWLVPGPRLAKLLRRMGRRRESAKRSESGRPYAEPVDVLAWLVAQQISDLPGGQDHPVRTEGEHARGVVLRRSAGSPCVATTSKAPTATPVVILVRHR